MFKLKRLINTISSHVFRFIFWMIYGIYLWSSRFSGESFLGSRLVEYPFVVENLPAPSSNNKVLLVGCAGDPLSTILAALGYETYGLDIKHVAINYPNFQFIRGDIRSTRFPTNYFDAVAAVSTIEHVGMLDSDYEGDKKAVKEIMRILKPGGTVILTCPVASRAKITRHERIYDVKSLNSLLKELTVLKLSLLNKNKDGYWIQCPIKDLPENGEAIVLVSATKEL